MAQLQTNRLILRQWRDSDIPTFIEMGQDPRVMEFFPTLWSEEKSRDCAAYFREHFTENHFGFFAVELKETQQFIGFVGIAKVGFDSHFTPAVEIGWRLASQHFGKGYATEAAREVLRFAFADLGLDEIVAFTVPANIPSRHVMEKIGMSHDEKDDFAHPKLSPDHRFAQHVLYRIKRLDFLNQRLI